MLCTIDRRGVASLSVLSHKALISVTSAHQRVHTVLVDECLTGYASGCLHMSNRNWYIFFPKHNWHSNTTMNCGFRFEVFFVSFINLANVKIRQNDDWAWKTCGSLHDNWDKTWKCPYVHRNIRQAYARNLVSTMSCNEEWRALACSRFTLSGLRALHSHPVWNPNIYKSLLPPNPETCFQLRCKCFWFHNRKST